MTEWVDLQIARNIKKAYELVVQDSGSIEDITDWEFYFTVKENMEDSDDDAVIKKDIGAMVGADLAHSNPVAGETTIVLTQEDTNRVGNYYYDVKYIDEDGYSEVIYMGRITFIDSITKRA